MKVTATVTLGFAAAVLAQDLSSLPKCGQVCISNMLGIAQSQFGCKAGDVVCYCTNVNFGYGVRDCSNESCSPQDAATVIQFGTAYCQQALAGLSSSASAAASSASGLSVLSAAASTASGNAASAASAASAATAASVQSTPITTSPLVATITTDGKTSVITTGFSTIYGPVTGAASGASSASGSAASGASSASGSGASKASNGASATGSGTSSGSSPSGTGSGSASGSASSSTSKGDAPMRTAAPILGAAAMGALLLL